MSDTDFPSDVERFYYNNAACPAPNVPIHPGASAVIFDAERRILILKRPRGGFWCLPGGRMDIGESAQDCCIRETQEETGLETEIVRLISVNTNPRSVVHYPDGNVHQSYLLCFEARIVGGELKSSGESESFRWMSHGEIDDINLIPDSYVNALDAWSHQDAAFIR
jgi:ADP-ribose pyrophosphatase YjhB (NUDIX family)